MSVERGIRFDLIARLCPNATGAELRSVATEAGTATRARCRLTDSGMFAIRARRRLATERDFLVRPAGVGPDLTAQDAVQKVIKEAARFSSTAKYGGFAGA